MSRVEQATMRSEIFIILMIIAILLFIIISISLQQIENENKKLEEQKIALQEQKKSLQELLKEYDIDKDKLTKLNKTIADMKKHQQPPLIVLDEANGYTFNTSSAKLSDNFKKQLDVSVIPKIKKIAKQHDCDIIEVYGYTDGEPFYSKGTANFDIRLHACLTYGCEIDTIKSSSNLELGMQRAVSVVEFLKSRLSYYDGINTIRPYSGGQFIDSNGNIANISDTYTNSSRRRIEIRLSHSNNINKYQKNSNPFTQFLDF